MLLRNMLRRPTLFVVQYFSFFLTFDRHYHSLQYSSNKLIITWNFFLNVSKSIVIPTTFILQLHYLQ